MIKKFRKLPVEIEAVRLLHTNAQDIGIWCRADVMGWLDNGDPYLQINTLEGIMTANVGDWIIKGVNGEFYPCKHDIFKKTYEAADD